MKKLALIILILSLLCSGLLIGCNNTDDDYKKDEENEKDDNSKHEIEEELTPNEKKIKAFAEFLVANEYAKAIEYYQNELWGNYELEYAAEDEIIAFCQNVNTKILTGEYTAKQAEAKINTVSTVVEELDIYPEGFENRVEDIHKSIASKVAFTAAKDLEGLKNYIDAATEYAKVVEGDVDYVAAREGYDRCVTAYKEDVFKKVTDYADKFDYLNAVKLLKNASVKLPEDSDIQAKLTVYEKTYINSVITAADEAFVTPATDYEASLNIINAGLQQCPTNEELKAKKDYYNSFAPIKLASLSKYDTSGTYGPTFLASEEDTLGKLHTDVFRTWSYMYDSAWVVYILNGNYNKLTFTVYGTVPSSSNVSEVTIRDYSQGDYDQSTLLYKNETVKQGSFPYEVEIDVTGVQMIRVYVEYGIAVSDAVLQRTVE